MYAKYFQGHHLVQLTNRCTNPLIIIVNLPLNSFHIMSRPVQFQGVLIITLSYHFLLSVVDLFLSSPHILSSIYSNWASLLPNSMFSTFVLILPHFWEAFDTINHSLLEMISSLAFLVSISPDFSLNSLVDPSQSFILSGFSSSSIQSLNWLSNLALFS